MQEFSADDVKLSHIKGKNQIFNKGVSKIDSVGDEL